MNLNLTKFETERLEALRQKHGKTMTNVEYIEYICLKRKRRECDKMLLARVRSLAPRMLQVVQESVSAYDTWNTMEGDGSPEPDYIKEGRAILNGLKGGDNESR